MSSDLYDLFKMTYSDYQCVRQDMNNNRTRHKHREWRLATSIVRVSLG